MIKTTRRLKLRSNRDREIKNPTEIQADPASDAVDFLEDQESLPVPRIEPSDSEAEALEEPESVPDQQHNVIPESQFTCATCQKSFASQRGLNVHNNLGNL